MSFNNCEEFYSQNPAPSNYSEVEKKVEAFVQKQTTETRVVLVTSGGTTVPLEHNTVRFVDNFSAGTRGSTSAEYFLKKGYAVIFLFRQKSLEPFKRHFISESILDILEITHDNVNEGIKVIDQKVVDLLPVIKNYQSALKNGKLLSIPFTTLPEYLHFLRAVSKSLASLESRALLYLAAAVSDFYVPPSEMVTHKIHSVDGPLNLQLQLVPKVLQPLVCNWVPRGFVVSFKLETDETLLISRARGALEKYGHKVVIANELKNRKYRVVIVEKDQETEINLSKEEIKNGIEIESKIVDILEEHHSKYMRSCCK